MATAVAQEEADLDPPLVSGRDVEGQAGPRVEPHRGPTQREASGLLIIAAVIIQGADQSQPLLLRRLDRRLQFSGGARQALCGGRKEGLQGRKGSVSPLALR